MLAAGFGERMYPLTEKMPKPAIPVLGRPLAIQTLRWIGGFRPDHVVLNLHHLADVMVDLLGDGTDYGLPPLRYSREERILGTAGGVRHARKLLTGSGPIVICNADFLSDIDIAATVATHRTSGLPATVVLAEHRQGYSRVAIDAKHRVLSLAGRPEVDRSRVAGEYLFTGCHVVEEELLDALPDDDPCDWVRDLYWNLAAEGRLGAVIHSGFWREFGSPKQYLEGSLSLLDCSARQRRRVTDHDPVRRLGGAVGALGPAVKYHGRARFRGYVALGFATHVREDCQIENSVIMPESWIGPACRLRHCIVGPGVELPAGFDATRALICSPPTGATGHAFSIHDESGLAVIPIED